ncbi:DUF983 domain-containing protein [Aureimonas psammosilenae]|uniref:DUF983 domain-containing protein n=1 Tax=Aureimonas psammosilenae TaxID=2495496 RepID=UPI001260D805|nr:DUF983 domain-containing protein [Aureimonas psammosilenae]
MTDPQASYPDVDPGRAAMRGRCPRCGEGPLFDGFLKLRPSCSRCGLDYAFADAGDGPAAFVVLIVGVVVIGLALWVEISFSPPLWVHLLLWLPLSVILVLPLMRLFKGLLIGLQYRNRAAEGRLDA